MVSASILLLLSIQPVLPPQNATVQDSPFFDFEARYPSLKIKAKSEATFREAANALGSNQYKKVHANSRKLYALCYESGSLFIEAYCYVFEEDENGFRQRLSAVIDGPARINWNSKQNLIEFYKISQISLKPESPSVTYKVVKFHF